MQKIETPVSEAYSCSPNLYTYEVRKFLRLLLAVLTKMSQTLEIIAFWSMSWMLSRAFAWSSGKPAMAADRRRLTSDCACSSSYGHRCRAHFRNLSTEILKGVKFSSKNRTSPTSPTSMKLLTEKQNLLTQFAHFLNKHCCSSAS